MLGLDGILRRGATRTRREEWDRRFLSLAREIAGWSKDPRTRCGAVIVDTDRRIVATGYNGFPRGMRDDDRLYADSASKYSRIIHCEMNALLFAADRRALVGATLYTWPMLSCDRCCAHAIQAGIKRLVAPNPDPRNTERWREAMERTRAYCDEAGVQVYEPDIPGMTMDLRDSVWVSEFCLGTRSEGSTAEPAAPSQPWHPDETPGSAPSSAGSAGSAVKKSDGGGQ